jgi:hypothetical protein
LGEKPKPDDPWHVGYWEAIHPWRTGVLDRYIPPAAVWGYRGSGFLGLSADEFRDYSTFDEAKPHIKSRLDPFLPPDMDEEKRVPLYQFLWLQRTRKRF